MPTGFINPNNKTYNYPNKHRPATSQRIGTPPRTASHPFTTQSTQLPGLTAAKPTPRTEPTTPGDALLQAAPDILGEFAGITTGLFVVVGGVSLWLLSKIFGR